jgi:hypothetical protein
MEFDITCCDDACRSIEEFELAWELLSFLEEAAADKKYCRHKDLSLGIVDAAKQGEHISSLPPFHRQIMEWRMSCSSRWPALNCWHPHPE